LRDGWKEEEGSLWNKMDRYQIILRKKFKKPFPSQEKELFWGAFIDSKINTLFSRMTHGY
jgi:hypothetical protein